MLEEQDNESMKRNAKNIQTFMRILSHVLYMRMSDGFRGNQEMFSMVRVNTCREILLPT